MNALRLTLASLLVCLSTAGCHVSTHNQGKDNNVEIGTPFGSMHVKTDKAANLAGLGITPYPGAAPFNEDDNDHSNHAADINMNFGSFHLGVKASSYLSDDPQEKILSFYRKDLARYGEVLQCAGNTPIGEPARTAQGLTCDENNGAKHGRVHTGSGLELRTGSPQHQHIVALEQHGTAIKIGLVALDLPGKLHARGGDEE